MPGCNEGGLGPSTKMNFFQSTKIIQKDPLAWFPMNLGETPDLGGGGLAERDLLPVELE